MLKDKTILGVIAARGGSKGVPRKNIKLAGGKPLIAWVIQAALKSAHLDRLVLSSDDSHIIEIAERYGCETPFVRPDNLAQDDSLIRDVILHAMDQVTGYDHVMLIQPTSPLTQTEDIDGCIRQIINQRGKSLVTVTSPEKSPYWMFKTEKDNRLAPLMGWEYFDQRRQDLPETRIPTGAVYIAESKWFRENRSFYSPETLGYEIPYERCLDIDTELDFKLFEVMIKHEQL